MRLASPIPVALALLASACGEALGPDDSFDMIGTWVARATPASDYDCGVEDLTLIITPPPADSVGLPPGSFFGTTSGGSARCRNWRRALPPGVVRGRAFISDQSVIVWDENMNIVSQTVDRVWVLELGVSIVEEQFGLGMEGAVIRNASHVEGYGKMRGGGVYYEVMGGFDVLDFGVNVTLTRR